MSDEANKAEDVSPWERREGEDRWYSRFLLYRDMGASRSLLGAIHLEEAKKSKEKQSISPPGAWSNAFKQWDWKKRAQAWDDEQERIALASTKYGRISERAKLIDGWISTQDAIMKVHIAEKGYVRADNMEQLRGLLDDMAKETGGRVKLTKAEEKISFDVQGARDRLAQKLAALPDDDDNDLI
jgi:hypothetical protein